MNSEAETWPLALTLEALTILKLARFKFWVAVWLPKLSDPPAINVANEAETSANPSAPPMIVTGKL